MKIIGNFFRGNEWYWRLARTIAQGIIGVIVANIDLLIGRVILDIQMRAIVVALCMAVLSPIMAEIGGKTGNRPTIDDEPKNGGGES